MGPALSSASAHAARRRERRLQRRNTSLVCFALPWEPASSSVSSAWVSLLRFAGCNLEKPHFHLITPLQSTAAKPAYLEGAAGSLARSTPAPRSWGNRELSPGETGRTRHPLYRHTKTLPLSAAGAHAARRGALGHTHHPGQRGKVQQIIPSPRFEENPSSSSLPSPGCLNSALPPHSPGRDAGR